MIIKGEIESIVAKMIDGKTSKEKYGERFLQVKIL
jgi:hypothetical protein